MNVFHLYKKTSLIQTKAVQDGIVRPLFVARGWSRTALIVACFLLTITSVMLFGAPPPFAKLYLGEVSKNDLYSPISFQYLDNTLMDEQKAQRLLAVPPVYLIDPALSEKTMARLAGLSEFFASLKAAGQVPDPAKSIKELQSRFGIELAESEFSHLVQEFTPAHFAPILAHIRNLLAGGMINASLLTQIVPSSADTLMLKRATGAEGNEIALRSIPIIEKIPPEILFQGTRFSPDFQRIMSRVALRLIETNLVFNQTQTEEAKTKTLANQPLVNKFVKKGETIIRRGEAVSRAHMDKIQGLNETLARGLTFKQRWLFPLGILVILGLLCSLFILYTVRYRRATRFDDKSVLLLCLGAILPMTTGYLLYKNFIATDFYWIGAVPLIPVLSILAATLFDPVTAILATFLASWALAVPCGMDLAIGLVNMTTGIAAVCLIKGVAKRVMLVHVGFFSGLVGALIQVGLGLTTDSDLHHMAVLAGGALFGGMACAAFVMAVLPLFEHVFHVTTDFSLLELGDLNHPLLKELMVRAPGTYHHSVMVASLSEAAAEQVNANPLLCRVGAYFHDIGKLEKPEYFSENEGPFEKSIHDELSPSMSSLIIINHVKNGVEKAKLHRLPKPIVDLVAQHHGTSLVFCFYKKAEQALAQQGHEVREEQFKYPGPKPQTREAGILMLADIVEAASRSLSKPTPGRIEGLVKELINNKFIEAQLDECPLTLKDLHLITERYIRILTAVFHTRREYPRNPRNPQSEAPE